MPEMTEAPSEALRRLRLPIRPRKHHRYRGVRIESARRKPTPQFVLVFHEILRTIHELKNIRRCAKFSPEDGPIASRTKLIRPRRRSNECRCCDATLIYQV